MPTGFDPIISTGASNANGDTPYFYALYDALMQVNSKTGAIIPKTAQSLTSSDGLHWTLKLRPNIKFTDGTPYDAAAVQFNWQRIADPANKAKGATAAVEIASMQVGDPLTLNVTLKRPDGQFPRMVANFIPWIGSPTAIRNEGAKFATAPVGAGPFKLQSFVSSNTASFTRNADYWMKGLPYADNLVIKLFSDATQRYNSFTTGQVNLIAANTALNLIPQAKSAGYNVLENNPPVAFALFMNTSKPPFNDPVARQAITYAIDRDRLNQTVDSGAAPVPTHLFSKDSPFYDPSATLPEYDPAKAQQLFDQYAASHGGPMKFSFLSSAASKPVLDFLQAQLAQYKNVSTTQTVTTPVNTVTESIAGNFQAVPFTISLIDPEPDMTRFFRTGVPTNYTRYSNQQVDAAIQQGRTGLTAADRKAAYETVQRLLIQDAPIAVFSSFPFDFIAAKNVRSISYFNGYQIDWSQLQVAK